MKVLFFLICFSSIGFAHNLGVVDAETIFLNYNKKNLLEEELNNLKNNFNVELSNFKQEMLNKELEITKKGSKASKKEKDLVKSLKQQFQEKIQSAESELVQAQEKYISELRTDIAVAAVLVGKEKGLEMVINKSATFYGGEDITKEVLEFLNNSPSASLQGNKITNDLLIN